MVGQVQNCLFCQTPSVIKCGISLVLSRYRDLINHYSTVMVRLTLSDKTATRSPVLATFLANRHDNTKLISLEQLMLWRVHPQTVNLIPLGKQSWFDSKLLHQFLGSLV